MTFAWCWLLLLALAASGQSNSQNDEEQARILTLENAWNQAVLQKDARAVEPLLDAELIYIDDDGTMMNKAQYLADVRSPEIHYQHIVSETMQVRLFGRSAVVIGVYREQGTKKGKPYLLHERFVDTWIDRNGAWMCVTSESTLIGH